MKPFLIISLLIAAFNCSKAQDSVEDSLKQMARLETETYLKRDSAAWLQLFVKDETTQNTYTNNTYNSILVGWDTISKIYAPSFKPQSKPSKYTTINQSNFISRHSDKVAWLSYDQVLKADGSDTLPDTHTRETRTFVKVNYQWKIKSLTTIDLMSYNTANPVYMENTFNATGYIFMAEKKFKEAIKVLELNVKLFPKSWNTYDSLGEAYAAAGNKPRAIALYEQSLKLNPKNENGIKILNKLKGR